MEAARYLARIGCSGATAASPETLRRLHRAHLLHIPFENLDVRLARPIGLDRAPVYEKIIDRGRGGFCYELNSLFAWLLEELGFEVTLLSGRVFKGAATGPDFDHLALMVELERPWLVDVGFGASFVEPLPIDTPAVQTHGCEQYRCVRRADGMLAVERRRRGSVWEPQYAFSLTPRRLSEFAAMCDHHQRSAESSFTRTVVCSRATQRGRVALVDAELVESAGEARHSRAIAGPGDLDGALRRHFGIALPPGELLAVAGMLGG